MKKKFDKIPMDRLPLCLRKLIAGPRRAPKPKGPKAHQMTTVVCWDMALHVGYYQVRDLFKEISGVLKISFSSTKRCAVVHFATSVAAEMALYQLTGCCLMGRPLKFAWYDKNSYDPNRDPLPVMELLPSRVRRTVCVGGFDTSLSIRQIRSMLRSHFRLNGERTITPENPDGTSTGKAFVVFNSHTDLVAALEQDGLDLGDDRKLCVTKWHEVLSFPWHYKGKGGGSVGGGSGTMLMLLTGSHPAQEKGPCWRLSTDRISDAQECNNELEESSRMLCQYLMSRTRVNALVICTFILEKVKCDSFAGLLSV